MIETVTGEVRFVQIAAAEGIVYGLTKDGVVYYLTAGLTWRRVSMRAEASS